MSRASLRAYTPYGLTPDVPPPNGPASQSLPQQAALADRTQRSAHPPPQIQQPHANGNTLANGGRMPFEDRRTPSVPLSEVVTLANELAGAKRSLADAPEFLTYVHDPKMRANYLAKLASIRSEVPKTARLIERGDGQVVPLLTNPMSSPIKPMVYSLAPA